MKDIRPDGKYVDTYQKIIESVVYTKVETTEVFKNTVKSLVIEYSPPIKFGNESQNWIKN